jgi:ABC-type branched-subunit amino acid transport system substrate-binding protein
MRRTIQTLLLVGVVTGLLSCGNAGGWTPVIGFAYADQSRAYLDLARATLLEESRPAPRFLHDSTHQEESSDGALILAATFSAMRELAIVVGPSNSRHALATAPAYNAAGLVHILPSATSRRLREAGPTTFSLVPDDSVQGEYLAEFVRRRFAPTRTVVFYVNDEYGEGLRSGIVSAIGRAGGAPAVAVPLGNGADIPVLLAAALRRYRPEVIFSAGRSGETGVLLRTVRRLAPGVPVVAGDGAYLPQVLRQEAGDDLSGLYVLAFWVFDSTDARHRAFAERVERILGRPPAPEDALTLDALLLADAAARASGPNRQAVRRYLEELGRGLPPFHGLTGEITFGAGRVLPLAMVRFVGTEVERLPDSLVTTAPAP